MMFFDQVLEEPDKKDSVEIAKYDTVYKNVFLYLQFLGVFFMDPDPDSGKKSLIRIRTKGPGSETLDFGRDPDP